MNRNHKTIIMLFLCPAVLGLVYLAACIFRLIDDSVSGMLETIPFPIITIIFTTVLIAVEKKQILAILLRDRYALTLPAFMAPTALFSVWTLAASHFGGVAWGGGHYFLEAITRYPNLGSINILPLLGMLAVLCASYLPVIIAWGYLSVWPKSTLYVLSLLAVAAYLSVALKIDINLWIAGLYPSERYALLFLTYGPISRTLSILCIGYLVMRLMLESKSS